MRIRWHVATLAEASALASWCGSAQAYRRFDGSMVLRAALLAILIAAPGAVAAQTAGSPMSTESSSEPGAGFKFGLQEQSEVWANLRGGGKQGASYNGLTTASLAVDLDKAAGWSGARFFVNLYDIHAHGPARSLVGNQQIVSNIEATPSIKLYDLWLEQRLFDERLAIRLGQ